MGITASLSYIFSLQRSHSLKKVRSLLKLEIGTSTKYPKNFFPNPQFQLN
ncbi:hypothetical protein [Nostoc sp. ChiQUE01b]|nr:hypothetical protein [Nostoc sp. ChiQUE01b]MDZ8264050.1 hypothetical protein [Nostoc sp. ChiQUE01b]